MNDEPKHQTSRAGMIFVLLAVGGSAIGVVGWHLLANRSGSDLDGSGFDMSVAPDTARSGGQTSPGSPAAPETETQTSLGMVKGGKSMLGPRVAPAPAKAQSSAKAGTAPADPKTEAALSFKDAAIKNEKLVDAFVRRMEAKHPSITQYGKDWVASPELRALRDNYWNDKDPLKFAYGLAKSEDFGKLLRKYATDPGIRDVLITGIKEAPPSLLGAAGGVLQSDDIAKNLVNSVTKAFGLPASLTAGLDGDVKPPAADEIMSDIMKSAAANQQNPVPLDQKDLDKAAKEAATQQAPAPNGFTPLGGR